MTRPAENVVGQASVRVGKAIRSARRYQEMTVADLVDRLATGGHVMSASALTRLEMGSRRATIDEVEAIAGALGVTPCDLTGWTAAIDTGQAIGVTPPTADEALWILKEFGRCPDWGVMRRRPDFYMRLCAAMHCADAVTLERIALGFPGLVTAWRWAVNDLDGMDRLRDIAAGVRS